MDHTGEPVVDHTGEPLPHWLYARIPREVACDPALQPLDIRDCNAPASTRVRAAEIVLDKAAKAIELEDIEARLAELERAAEETKQGRR